MLRWGVILFALISAGVIFGFSGTTLVTDYLADWLLYLFLVVAALGLLIGGKSFHKKTTLKLLKRIGNDPQRKLKDLGKLVSEGGIATKYAIGQIVYDKIRPGQTLIIKRIASSLYYCQPVESYATRVLTFLERDLMPKKLDDTLKRSHSFFGIKFFGLVR